MTKSQADGEDEVEPTSEPSAVAGAEERAAALLDRWRSHHGDSPPPASGGGEASDPDAPEVSGLPEVSARPAAPKHVAPRPNAATERISQRTTQRTTDAVTAGREIMAALGRTDEATPDPAPSAQAPWRHAAAPEPAAPEPAAPEPAAPEPATPEPPAASRSEVRPSGGPEVGPSLNVDFEPRLGARQVIGWLLLLSAAATAGAAYLAYEDARPLTLGAAGTLLVLTLLLYAVRAGSAPTYLAIRSGQLEVRRAKELERFDLTSRFTRIEVVGKPGRPGWKVRLGRFGREPLVITASLVDPHHFTTELERYRPRA